MFAQILAALTGFFGFFRDLGALVRSFRKLPEERRQAIVEAIGDEAREFAKGGRPKW